MLKTGLICSVGVKRSGGVENLAETGSSSGTDEGASTLGRGRSRSRSLEASYHFSLTFCSRGRSGGRGVEEADTPRFLGPQVVWWKG